MNCNAKVCAETCDSAGYRERVRGYLCASVPGHVYENWREHMREHVRTNMREHKRDHFVKTA